MFTTKFNGSVFTYDIFIAEVTLSLVGVLFMVHRIFLEFLEPMQLHEI